MDNEFDVVIVGAGPVGLWLACELALAKVRVVVLERRTERVDGRLRCSRFAGSPTGFSPAAARSRPCISARSIRGWISPSSTHAFPSCWCCLRRRPRLFSRNARSKLARTCGVATLSKRWNRMPLFAPDGNWEHRGGVSGQRLPDRELVLQDGSRTTLYRLLENGRWVRLQLASDEAVISDVMTVVALAPGANEGLFVNFTSVLVRPDGYLAHVRPAADARGAERAAA